jgi:hypothetical protein
MATKFSAVSNVHALATLKFSKMIQSTKSSIWLQMIALIIKNVLAAKEKLVYIFITKKICIMLKNAIINNGKRLIRMMI